MIFLPISHDSSPLMIIALQLFKETNYVKTHRNGVTLLQTIACVHNVYYIVIKINDINVETLALSLWHLCMTVWDHSKWDKT